MQPYVPEPGVPLIIVLSSSDKMASKSGEMDGPHKGRRAVDADENADLQLEGRKESVERIILDAVAGRVSSEVVRWASPWINP